jgi:hypothetical protein
MFSRVRIIFTQISKCKQGFMFSLPAEFVLEFSDLTNGVDYSIIRPKDIISENMINGPKTIFPKR